MRLGELYSVVAAALATNFNGILGVSSFMRIKKTSAWITQTKSDANVKGNELYAKFIKDEYKDKWLHLDIAGTAYREKAWGYNQAGASGDGVRMNLYFLQALSKEN